MAKCHESLGRRNLRLKMTWIEFSDNLEASVIDGSVETVQVNRMLLDVGVGSQVPKVIFQVVV